MKYSLVGSHIQPTLMFTSALQVNYSYTFTINIYGNSNVFQKILNINMFSTISYSTLVSTSINNCKLIITVVRTKRQYILHINMGKPLPIHFTYKYGQTTSYAQLN